MGALTHTPGPWAIEVDPRDETFTVYEAKTNANLNICSVLGAGDAALIAAAPATTAALVSLMDAVNSGESAMVSRAMRKAGAALSRVIGVAA